MKCAWGFGLLVMALIPASMRSQTSGQGPSCPITIEKFDPSGVSARVQNTSGKNILGLSFYAALADATEHWQWLHWDHEDFRPLHEFGWNRALKAGETKKLSWGLADLDFDHGGGGAFVLTSVLFDDGSRWEEPPNRASCKILWFNSHKKVFTKPVELPLRR